MCGAVLTVIKTYKYIVYVKNFISVNCGAGAKGIKTFEAVV